MGSLRHPLENALDRELRRLERTIIRAWLALSLVGVVLALVLAVTVSKRLGFAMAAMGAALVAVFAISDRVVRVRPLGKRSSLLLVAIEAVVPWAFFAVLQLSQGAAYALASWVPPLLFAALIVAWVARLEPRAPLVVGAVGAATFLAIYFVYVHPNVPTGAARSIIQEPPLQLSRAFSLLVAGAIGAGVARALRDAIGHADRTVRRDELFGKYRITKKIGAGAGGTVHEAVYCPEGGFERRVAVKQLHPNLVAEEKFVAGFRKEAELGARLAHPNVVTIHDFGRNETTFFMAMEFVDGLPLSKLVHRARAAGVPFPPEVVAHIGRSVLRGLDHAHAHRFLHRDVCPQNVLVSRLGEVKLTDFGIARVLGEAGEATTRTIAGHEAYIAPEQLEGRAGFASDLFSAGVVLWELLAGRRLFARDNPAATLLAVTTAVVPKLNDEWDAFFVRALARSPSERFAIAEAMLAALDELACARVEGADAKLGAMVTRFCEEEASPAEQVDLQETIRESVSR
jgi:eukaryotic-like serine/threonine-protein kinase